MSEDAVQILQHSLNKYGLRYCFHVSQKQPFVKCKSPTTSADLQNMHVYINGLSAIAGGMKTSVGVFSSYTLNGCISLCESISICAVVEWRSNYCYLASEADFPQNATISAVDPIKTVVILQNHLTLNTRLLAKQFDTTAKRGKRYKISHDGKTYTRLRDRCGEFCRVTDGCRGFEVSNRTDFSYDCVLYAELRRSY